MADSSSVMRMRKQDSSWRRVRGSASVASASAVLVLVLGQLVMGYSVEGKQMSETLQRALSAVRGPSPGAKKLLNIPEDGGLKIATENKTIQIGMAGTMDANIRETVREHKQSMRMLGRIAQKVTLDKIPYENYNYIQKAEEITGMPKEFLRTLDGKPLTPVTELEEIDWRVVHSALDTFYVGEQRLPTTKELFDNLFGKIPPHTDIRTFRLKLMKMGFVWKRITIQDKSERLVIIERPKLRFERFDYLKKATEYRKEKMMVYISETILQFNENTGAVEYCNLAHNKIHDLIAENKKYLYILCAVSCEGIYGYEVYEKFEPTTFKKWLLKIVLQKILIPYKKRPSVVIFTGGDYTDSEILKLPKETGLKVDMMEWLDYHSVPYDRNMSKHDLWTLVEKYTNIVDKIYEIDSILAQSGHSVLRVPNFLKQLTPAFLVYKMVANNVLEQNFISPYKQFWMENWRKCMKNVLVSIEPEILQKFFAQVASEEDFLLNKEKQMDLQYDALLKKSKFAKYEPVYYDSDLPSWSDDDD